MTDWSLAQPLPNFAGMAQNAFLAGQKQGLERRKLNALASYAQDPQGSINALMGVDPATALQLQQGQRAQTDFQNQQTQFQQSQQARQSNIDAAGALAGGDTQGAMAAAAKTGNVEQVQQIQQQAIAHHQQQQQIITSEATKLRSIYAQGGQPALQAAFDAEAPNYKIAGLSDDGVAALRQQLTANPDATLAALATPKTYTYKDMPDGTIVAIDQDGNVSNIIGQGIDAKDYQTGQGGGAQPNAAQPRGLRNNNPLNLEATVKWDGMTGSDGRYAQFSTPEQGWAAADQNLQAYNSQHGLNTVAGIVGRWTPASENGTRTAAEIQTVANALGVKPNDPLPMDDPNFRHRMLGAMAGVENGKQLAYGQGAPQQAASQGQGSGPRVTNIGGSSSKLDPDQLDFYAQMYLQNGQMPAIGTRGVSTLTRTEIAKRAADISTQMGSSGPMAAAKWAQFKSDSASMTGLTKQLDMVQSSESTVEKNAKYTLSLAPKGADPTGIPWLNAPIQKLKQSWGNAQVAAFNNSIGTVADEYAKVMSSANGNTGSTTDSTRAEAYKRLDAASNLQQLNSIMEAMKVEMHNRIQSMTEQKAQINARLSGQPAPQSATPAAAPVAAPLPPPKPGAVQQGYRFNGGDPSNQKSWTKVG